MNLRRADEQFRIERRTRNECYPIAAADHIRTYERMTKKARGNHICNDPVECAPFVHLVVKPHDNGLELESPCIADFREWVF